MAKALVTYFSASGVTAAVASRLAKAIEADIFEIKPKVPYSSADLNYVNPLARCNREKIGRKDVPVEGVVENMAEYDTIYLGFPIWYGKAPRVVFSFLDAYSFKGKTVIPFITSGSTGISSAASELKSAYPGVSWKTGDRLNGKSSEQLKSWLESLGIKVN